METLQTSGTRILDAIHEAREVALGLAELVAHRANVLVPSLAQLVVRLLDLKVHEVLVVLADELDRLGPVTELLADRLEPARCVCE